MCADSVSKELGSFCGRTHTMSQQPAKDAGSFPVSLMDNHLYGLPSGGRGYLPISEISGGVLRCKGGMQQEMRWAVLEKDHSVPGGFISLWHFPPLQDVIGFHQVAPDPSSVIASCFFPISSPWFELPALLLLCGLVFIQGTKHLLRHLIVRVPLPDHTFWIYM